MQFLCDKHSRPQLRYLWTVRVTWLAVTSDSHSPALVGSGLVGSQAHERALLLMLPSILVPMQAMRWRQIDVASVLIVVVTWSSKHESWTKTTSNRRFLMEATVTTKSHNNVAPTPYSSHLFQPGNYDMGTTTLFLLCYYIYFGKM
jgi:hypothetical protein